MYNLIQKMYNWYKKCIICLISIRKLSDVLPAFTFSRAIDNLLLILYRGVNLAVNILIPFETNEVWP